MKKTIMRMDAEHLPKLRSVSPGRPIVLHMDGTHEECANLAAAMRLAKCRYPHWQQSIMHSDGAAMYSFARFLEGGAWYLTICG